MKKLIVIDGNSLLFRAYYATSYGQGPIMSTRSGVPTNAIFAFANMLAKMLSSFKGGESIFIGFDADSHTFRKEEFASYKANRKPCPEPLKQQFPISRELCQALGIMSYEEHGIEADDICGSVAKMGSKDGYEVTIYTSDKDYLQLIDPNISVSLLKTGLSNMELINNGNMKEKFGFSPLQIIDYKGLRGDSSDNLPGIPGVGEKTAVKLIQEFGSLEKIIEAAKEKEGKVWERIRDNAEQGRQCYRLATIIQDAKLPFSLEDLLYKGYSFAEINSFANKYELKQFAARLPLSLKIDGSSSQEVEEKEIASFAKITFSSSIGLSLDIDYENYHDETMRGLAIADGKNVYYERTEDILKDNRLKEMLENPSIKKSVYDGKAIIYSLHQLGIKIKGIQDDLLISAYLLDSTIASDPRAVYSSFGVDIAHEEEENSLLSYEKPKTTSQMAYGALKLAPKAKASLKSVDAFSLYQDIEMPLMETLAEMEIEGFPIHQEELERYGERFRQERNVYEQKIYEMAGESFNLNSPKQMADVLFKKLKLPNLRHDSTSIEVLSELAKDHPIIEEIIQYRKYAKLISTYIDGLLPHIKKDEKIHSYFNQAQTSTGRLSSSSPNLQNISARDPEGKLIRKAFYYEEDDLSLVSFDYGQIELRILAALSKSKKYIEVFNGDRDIHEETAKHIFHTEKVTPLMRRRAKAVNFAIIYGTTVFGLAEQIGGSRKEAEEIIHNFYETYPEVTSYLSSVIHDAETKGYVTTLFGRRRYLRDVNSPLYAKREAARRAALNAPVQGSAADLIKIAMVKVANFLKENKLKTQMVLQIHDELIFKVPSTELAFVKEKVAEIMTSAVSLPVKLTVEVGVGHSWYDSKD